MYQQYQRPLRLDIGTKRSPGNNSEGYFMRTSAIQSAVLLAALVTLPTHVAFGQVVGAILSGTVTDPSRAVVPAAKVTIRNLSTGVVTQVAANEIGIYNAINLLP